MHRVKYTGYWDVSTGFNDGETVEVYITSWEDGWGEGVLSDGTSVNVFFSYDRGGYLCLSDRDGLAYRQRQQTTQADVPLVCCECHVVEGVRHCAYCGIGVCVEHSVDTDERDVPFGLPVGFWICFECNCK